MFYKMVRWWYEASHGDWFFPYEIHPNLSSTTRFLRLRDFYGNPKNPYMKKPFNPVPLTGD